MGNCCAQRDSSDKSDKELLKGKFISEQEESPIVDQSPLENTIPKQSVKYQAIKGDQLDLIVAKILNDNQFTLPVIRITQGKYLLGTDSKSLVIKGDICVVRVGGGFEKLEEYLRRNQDSELDKIRRIMQEQKKSYNKVIFELLQKYGADQSVLQYYQKQKGKEVPSKQSFKDLAQQ
eukprot:403342856